VLRGAKTEKIKLYKHDTLSTYGIGKDKSLDEWRMLARSLLHQGLVEQSSDGYGVLKLNPLSWEVMRRQRTVSVAVLTVQKESIKEKSQKAVAAEMLLQRLRGLRKSLADEQGVAPYAIFADSSLKLMCQTLPRTKSEFAKLSGVGKHKLTEYGDRFVAEIQVFCRENNIPEVKKEVVTTSEDSPSTTEIVTLQLYKQGLSIPEIAKERKLRPTTIIRHLSDLIEKDESIDINQLVDLEKQKKIRQVLDVLGDISLTPIKEYLGDEYSFDDIRFVRGIWRKKGKK
jgi:ATP-dependent DNA helicase RecQ